MPTLGASLRRYQSGTVFLVCQPCLKNPMLRLLAGIAALTHLMMLEENAGLISPAYFNRSG
jgi:hypothetical protein